MARISVPKILSGTIRHFQGVGRSLGYPTANISTETELKDGVYFGYSDLLDFKHHPSLIFIGTPTTVGATERRVEAHLLDIPDEDYYGELLRISAEYFYRANITFKNIDALKIKMLDDEMHARKWFKSRHNHL